MLACLSGMFVPNLHRRDLAVRYFSGERAAVLLMLILACLSGLLVRNLNRGDLAVRHSAEKVHV